ncbi:hypothetical protein [Latilactobacillus fuchuensis]|uniref:Membrane protein n=2 Tax=Latilactobacillus fuchuensis TaxID=164393 RepID=A0A2N9DU27_9LACO|nr:hypothetical protein [Latilactobacillus fuchuensis]KRL58895.1 membrane protein [Latilactobacillus fuchuensis DSM 14340 = JCM 11249]SPC37532.1 putative membrane protein [Latilactobacillus fuchuensis]
MFYLNQKHLPTTGTAWQLVLFNVINFSLIVLFASWPFPKHYSLDLGLTSLLGLILILLLVISPQSKPKRSVAIGLLILTLLLSGLIGHQSEQWIGLLLGVTSLLVLFPFIFPEQFQSRLLKLVSQLLLAPFFFLTAQLFSVIHFLPESLLIKVALFLLIIFLMELTSTTGRLAQISYILWLLLIILTVITHLIGSWQLILFAGAQLLLLATHLHWLKNNVLFQEAYIIILIVSIFLTI